MRDSQEQATSARTGCEDTLFWLFTVISFWLLKPLIHIWIVLQLRNVFHAFTVSHKLVLWWLSVCPSAPHVNTFSCVSAWCSATVVIARVAMVGYSLQWTQLLSQDFAIVAEVVINRPLLSNICRSGYQQQVFARSSMLSGIILHIDCCLPLSKVVKMYWVWVVSTTKNWPCIVAIQSYQASLAFVGGRIAIVTTVSTIKQHRFSMSCSDEFTRISHGKKTWILSASGSGRYQEQNHHGWLWSWGHGWLHLIILTT